MLNPVEQPFMLLAAAVISLPVLWLVRVFLPDKHRLWQTVIPLILVLLAFGLDFFVATDREKIADCIHTGIEAFKAKDITPIKEIIAADYSDSAHVSRELIIAYCQALFEIAPVKKVTLQSTNTQIDPPKATFTTEAVVRFAEESEPARPGKPFLIIKARLYLRKNPEKKWLIYSSEIFELDRQPINWNQIKNI